jgi:hypothetical protein
MEYEQHRNESQMGMGGYPPDRHFGDGILYASLKIIVRIQCFFRIKPFLCSKKGHFL